MYLERVVFQARPGRAREVVKLFKEVAKLSKKSFKKSRICTDFTGEFWTVVMEREVPSIDAMIKESRTAGSDPKMRELFRDYHEMIKSGKRELYVIE